MEVARCSSWVMLRAARSSRYHFRADLEHLSATLLQICIVSQCLNSKRILESRLLCASKDVDLPKFGDLKSPDSRHRSFYRYLFCDLASFTCNPYASVCSYFPPNQIHLSAATLYITVNEVLTPTTLICKEDRSRFWSRRSIVFSIHRWSRG